MITQITDVCCIRVSYQLSEESIIIFECINPAGRPAATSLMPHALFTATAGQPVSFTVEHV